MWSTLAAVKPADSPVVTESTSTIAQQLRFLPTTRSGAFFATASGGIGWGVPAAVGVALGDQARGVKRRVVATIGDGSFQYSVQSLWTAAQHRLPVVYVVMRNGEYSILKSFAEPEKTPGVPGLDIASIATGFGCRAVNPGNERVRRACARCLAKAVWPVFASKGIASCQSRARKPGYVSGTSRLLQSRHDGRPGRPDPCGPWKRTCCRWKGMLTRCSARQLLWASLTAFVASALLLRVERRWRWPSSRHPTAYWSS